MSADFNTYLLLKGKKDQLKEALDVLKKLENDEDIYISFVMIGKKAKNGMLDTSSGVNLNHLTTDEEIDKFLDTIDKNLAVEANGPYGNFGWLYEVKLFEKIADAAPGLSFKGTISGFNTGGDEAIWCKTKNKKLHIFYEFAQPDYSNDNEEEFDDHESDLPDAEFIYDPIQKTYTKVHGNIVLESDGKDIYLA